MNQLKIYRILVVVLIVLNAGTLAMMWWERSHPGRRGRLSGIPEESFLTALNLNPEQSEAFRLLRHQHLTALHRLQIQDRRLHDNYFDMIFLPAPDSSLLQQRLDSMLILRREMEVLTYNHFRELKGLLDEEQGKVFRKNFRRMLDRVMPSPRRLPSFPERKDKRTDEPR